MPGVAQQRPIKGLNKGPSAKRFVFKSFSQRIEEVDLDVFRSLAPLKSEPTGGSSFFHESLVAWRELNSAVDFTSIYEQLLPIVQTMPQLILHKEVIMNTLLSHLQLSAVHSLEPILSLIAVLSRDLRFDFTPFIPRFLGACVELFQSGGDHEPDIIEQVFTSMSYIFKYMQKSLCKDINFALKATKRLRYYRRLYVQEFTAEAVSYLLRNSCFEQLIKGIRRLLNEVHSKPLKENINSCSSLLWYTLKGPCRTLHSRAEPVLRLLLDKSTFQSVRKKDPGGQVIVEVLSQVFHRLIEGLDQKHLAPLWCCLLDELNSFLDPLCGSSCSQEQLSSIVLESDGERNDIATSMDIDGADSVGQRDMVELNGLKTRNFIRQEEDRKLSIANLLSLVNHLFEFRKGSQVYDVKPLFSLSHRLLESSLLTSKDEASPSGDLAGSFSTAEAKVNQLPFQTLRFLLNMIKSHSEITGVSGGQNAMMSNTGPWNLLWKHLDPFSLLHFVRGLLEHGKSSFHPFLPNILRAFDMLIHSHSMDVLPLMMELWGKMDGVGQCLSLQKSQYEKLYSFVVSTIKEATERLNAALCDATPAPEAEEPALIWAALKCCSHLVLVEESDKLLVWNYALALDHWLSTAEVGADIKQLQEFLLATALSSELKLLSQTAVMSLLSSRGSDFLKLGMRYKDSPHVLKCVAELLDLRVRQLSVVRTDEIVPLELKNEGQALSLVEKNLGSHSKLLRLSTLQLLVYLDHMAAISPVDDSVVTKRRKILDGKFHKGYITTSDSIFEQLRSLEAAPFSLEAGRQSSLILTRLKVKAVSGSLPVHHLTSLTHAMVGILFNRFGLLWDGAVDCLSGLLETRNMSVWETFTDHLELCQSQFLQRKEKLYSDKGVNVEGKSTGKCLVSLMEHCRHDQGEITDVGTVTTLLLKAAQKIPTVAEGRTRQLIPLFLTFVGHNSHIERSSAQTSMLCGGKDWKIVLKEWLILLSLMKNAVSYFKGSAVKEILINRFLLDGDPDIQSKVLECILNWKDNHLIPYEDHLKNLISPKTAREEMTIWNIGKECENVQLNHRDGLVATIMRLLFPKILKTKTSLHNKTTGGVQRKVVLAFLASLDVQELALFFNLILKPLESAFTMDGKEYIQGDHAWELAIKQGVKPTFINWVDGEGTLNLSYKKKTGFLHMIKDVLETFDKEHVTPYLHAVLAFSFRILEACQVNNGQCTISSTSTVTDQVFISGKKDVRTLALKVLAIVFSKYDDAEFCPIYWDSFFGTVRPMIARFAEEGASGDAPSVLFSCFLAMSKSLALASVLLGEKELVPNLLPLISHKNASNSIIGAALSFIENILALEEEDLAIVTELFLPHLPTLLSNLRTLLSSNQKGTSGRRLSSSVKRGLYILLKISRHISSSADAVQLLDVLLPYLLTQKKTNQGELVDVLRVLQELVANLNSESCRKTLPFLGQLLSSCSHLDVRSAICDLLSAFSLTDSALSFVAGVISGLNALSPSTVGEYDYERRLQAYGCLSVECFRELTYEQAVLVILQGCYDIQSDDISIRHSASKCLSNFVQFLASRCETNQSVEMIDEGSSVSVKGRLSSCWDQDSARVAVQKVLLPNVRRSMGLDSLTVRREWVSLLREMALNLHFITPLGELLPLINTDPEVDFFNNINHIQTHRRIRAMSRFKEICCAGSFSQGTLVRIFEPLFTNSLFEGKGDKDGNLVQSAVEVIACIAAQLQWDPYYSLIMRLFRMISSHPEHEKSMIKLLCSVLDKFHFNEELASGGGPEEKSEEQEAGEEEEQAFKIPGIELVGSAIPEEILRQLKLRVLPECMKLMVSKTNIINVSVALAVVKVLQLMPSDIMELELPRIVQNAVNLLKNRSQIVRDEARAGLLAIVGVLGARYFGFILGKLQDSLKRGYEVHVLGFTLNALLAKIFPQLEVGEIDYCAEKVLNLLGNDIFEDAAEEKEVEKLAFKMKEIKRSGSYESLKLVAQIVTFHLHGLTLLNAVKRRLKDALVPKTKGKIERVLRQLALGIQLNASLNQEELFVFVHGLVEDGIMDEKLGVRMPLSGIKGHVSSTTVQDTERIPNYYLITEFALHLFESHLKQAKLNKSDPSLLSMLDPMVALLYSCLESKHGAILGLAMKCLCHLVRLQLPTVELCSADLLTKTLIMAQGFGKSENKTVRPCFNLLVALLKHANGAHVSEDQLRTILQFPIFVDLEKAESNTVLVLLKAIVGRKLLVPELYDIINRVSRLMVTSHVAVVRQYCCQITLQFLLDYPLGVKRLQQHLDFFIANLSYENATGRESILEMLHSIIVKFPVQAVDEQLETFFLPLVTRLVNDDSNQLRAMVATVLKVLMGRVSQRSLQRILQFCFSWLQGDKKQVWRAAGQVLGFAVEVMKEKYISHVEDSLTLSLGILNYVLEVNEVEKKEIMTVGPVLWPEAYQILAMLEKLLKQFPNVCAQKSCEGLWEILFFFLLHQHVWVRRVSSRLLDVYFTACSAANNSMEAAPFGENGQQAFLLQPSRLMLLAAVLCQQLSSELDEGLAGVLEKNLLFVSVTLHSAFFDGKDQLSWVGLVCEEDAATQARVANALRILKVRQWISNEGAKAGRFADDPTKRNKEVAQSVSEGTVTEARYYGLYPVIKYLERVSLQANDLQMKTVFHVYEALLTSLGNGVQPYLSSMLLPLYRSAEALAAKQISDDAKIVAENVLDRIRETFGTEEFVQAYNETRKITKDVRETRRRAKKLKVLVDPEGNARRKLKLNLKRQAQKKNKKRKSWQEH